MSITSFNLKTGLITVEFDSARSAEGQPIYPDPTDLEGTTVTTNISADAFFDYLQRNDVSMVDVSGNWLYSMPSWQTGGWVCYATQTGTECRFQQN